MEAPWLTPPKISKRLDSAGKVMAAIFWGSQWMIMIDYLEQGLMINGALRRIEEAMPGNHKKEARKSDPPCSALAGQCPAQTSHNAMTAGTE